MAIVLGVNAGFVTTAPTSDPSASGSSSSSNGMRATGDTSSSDVIRVTEVGFWIDSGAGADENPSYSVALYSDSTGVPGDLLFSSTGHTISGVNSWQVVNSLDWSISTSTKYWIVAWVDGTTSSVTFNRASSGAAGREFKISTGLDDPFDGGALSDVDGAYAQYALVETEAGVTRKIKISGTFQDKPIKTKVAGVFVDKPIKIKVGGNFQDA